MSIPISLAPVDIASEVILRLQILRCYTGIMNNDPRPLADLRDAELLHRVECLAHAERAGTAQLIAALAELDARRLYLGEGFSSLFTYCTHYLKLSEHAAYGRIEAARVVRRFPNVLPLIADGSITLTNLCLLAPHMTSQNCSTILAAATHKSKREVECHVAALQPRPDVPSTVRKVPQASTSNEKPQLFATLEASSDTAAPVHPSFTPPRPSPPARTTIAPLSPGRYKLQLTITQETHDRLCHAQNLLRHSASSVDPATVFDRALTLLIAELERKKLGRCVHARPNQERIPRVGSRHVPRAVRRDVWKRDDGQCAFIGASGRCAERGRLEFHHVIPFAGGGPATVENIELRCRTHNAYEAELEFELTECLGASEAAEVDGHGPGPS